MDMQNNKETLADTSPAQERSSREILNDLKRSINTLPGTPDEVVLSVDMEKTVSGPRRNQLQEQMLNKQYKDLEAKLGSALESGKLSEQEAKDMERLWEQKKVRLVKDPTFKDSLRESILTRGANAFHSYWVQQAQELPPVASIANGTINGALWSGAIGAASLLPLGAASYVAGPLVGTVASAVTTKAGELLEYVGIPKKWGAMLAKTAAIIGISAIPGVNIATMSVGAAIGAATYALNYWLQSWRKSKVPEQLATA